VLDRRPRRAPAEPVDGDPTAAPGGEPELRRPPAERTAPGPRPSLPHVPGFDGLRAIALLAVLAFHQGFEVLKGGFLGLSSFFTLSGFLVATLVLAEWSQDGRLALGRFWEHRARRILPLLIFTVALVVALQTTLRVGSGPGFAGDVLAALGQVLNWRFAFSGDGFASVLTDPSPVQHLWPLSALVQMTLLFPLAFVGLMRLTGRRWRTAGAAFGLAAVASFLLASQAAERSGNDGLAYYATYTRVGELLVGVVLAYAVLSPRIRRVLETPAGVKAVRLGAPGALVVLLWLWHSTSLYSTNLFGGVTAVNAVLTAWVILAVTAPGPVATGLGSLPLRTIGRFAFAAYLLHWPLFLLIGPPRIDLPELVLFAARLGATLAAAVVLTYAIEQPFRRRLRVSGRQLGLALGTAMAIVALAAFVLPEQPPANVSLTVDDGSGPGDLDVVVPSGGEEELSLAVVGGPLAGSLTPGFEAWNGENPDEQVRVATHVADGCPLGGAGEVRLAGATVGDDLDCVGFGPRLPELLDAAAADVTLVVPDVGDLGSRRIDRQWRHLGQPEYDAWLRERLSDLADTLESHGKTVVWATTLHVRLEPAGEGDWTDVADNDPARVDRLNELVRAVAGEHGAAVVDLDAWAHRLPRGGEFGTEHRAGGQALTEVGATQAAAWLVPELADLTGGESGDGGD
jgi:peptidoglycan/LPS O-acetylase OafA/YrhL